MKRILEEVARRKLLEEESRGQRWRRLLKEFVSTYYEKAKEKFISIAKVIYGWLKKSRYLHGKAIKKRTKNSKRIPITCYWVP